MWKLLPIFTGALQKFVKPVVKSVLMINPGTPVDNYQTCLELGGSSLGHDR